MDSATEEYGLDLEKQNYKVLLIWSPNRLYVNYLLPFCWSLQSTLPVVKEEGGVNST